MPVLADTGQEGAGKVTSLPLADPVKSVVDRQSGRFEFFKQTLTLSAAGLAGLAALLIDPTKIPVYLFSRIVVAWCALFLAATLLACLLGISTYSNLLVIVAADSEQGSSEEPRAERFAVRVVHYARITLIGLLLSGLGLLVFAGSMVLRGPYSITTAEAALATARALVSKETGQPPERLFLTRMEAKDDALVVTYHAETISSEMAVEISKKDGAVIGIKQSKIATTPSEITQP
jgi:hypothetical protein